MDIEYKGGNCTIITIKKTVIAVDPKISGLGLKDQGAQATLQLATQPQFVASHGEETVIVESPGEYEVSNVSVRGIAVRTHLEAADGPLGATMYALSAEDINLAVLGCIHPDLSEAQLEALGVVDVLVLPVGGNGYTLDATGAVELIRKIDPKVVIPTHYADPAVKYPVPQADVELFIKELGATVEVSNKLKLKAGSFGDTLVVQQLNRIA